MENRMLTEEECESVAMTMVAAVCVVLGYYAPRMSYQNGLEDDSESSSEGESEVESARRQSPTSMTNTETLIGIMTSIGEYFRNSTRKHLDQLGPEIPSEDLMTALAQLARVVASIVESLRNSNEKLYEQFGSENSSVKRLMTSAAQHVQSVKSFADSFQNRKKNLYEQLKALEDFSKQDLIRAMIMLVKDMGLAEAVMAVPSNYKGALVMDLLREAPRDDDRNESAQRRSRASNKRKKPCSDSEHPMLPLLEELAKAISSMRQSSTKSCKKKLFKELATLPDSPKQDLQTQSKDELESEGETGTSSTAQVSGERSGVESVQRCSLASNNRKKPCSDSEHPMLSLLEELASAISYIADFFKKPCAKKLYQQLENLSDLSEEDLNRAMLLFAQDLDMAEGFMVLDEEHKMDFVFMLLEKA